LPDALKAARQIAALANAARGERALWIVGLDEKGRRVVQDPNQPDLAAWWSQVSKRFDGITPEMDSLAIPTAHGLVTVLAFETDRSPYVVKTDGQGGVNREVPWRNGTRTDTATRAQLLSLLVENATLPEFELIDPKLTAYERNTAGRNNLNDLLIELSFTAELFISATERAMLPKHRWSLTVTAPEWDNASTRPPVFELRASPLRKPNQRPFTRTASREPRISPPDEYYEPESPHGVLVLQRQFVMSLFVVTGAGSGLADATPVRPVPQVGEGVTNGAGDTIEQSSNLVDGQRNQPTATG